MSKGSADDEFCINDIVRNRRRHLTSADERNAVSGFMSFCVTAASRADFTDGGIERIAQRPVGPSLAQPQGDVGKALGSDADVRQTCRLFCRRIAAQGSLDARNGGHQRIGIGVTIAVRELSRKTAVALGGRDRRVDPIIVRFLRQSEIDTGLRQRIVRHCQTRSESNPISAERAI